MDFLCLMIILIGSPIAIYLNKDGSNSNFSESCKSSSTTEYKKEDTTRSDLYRKFDNLTTYEIDKYLKENDLHNEYWANDGYGRETKINKIIERKMRW